MTTRHWIVQQAKWMPRLMALAIVMALAFPGVRAQEGQAVPPFGGAGNAQRGNGVTKRAERKLQRASANAATNETAANEADQATEIEPVPAESVEETPVAETAATDAPQVSNPESTAAAQQGAVAAPRAAAGAGRPAPGQASTDVRQIGTPKQMPELPENEYRIKTGEPTDQPIRLDVDNQDLGVVIQLLAPMIGKTFDIDQQVAAQKVTVISHEEIPADMAYYVLESILASRGMKMVETLDGHLIKIRPVDQDVANAPIVVDGDVTPKGYDNYAYHIVQVSHGDPAELSNLLKTVGSDKAQVNVYGRTRTLILYDTAVGLRNMLRLLETVDIAGYDEAVEFFWLKFTRAEVIAEQISEVLLGGEGEGQAGGVPAPPSVRTPATLRAQRQQTLQTESTIIGAELSLRMVPDERLNALIVVASQPLIEQVRELVERLDTPTTPDTNNFHVRELLHADAEAMETALVAMLGGVTPRQSGAAGGGGGGGGVGGQAGGAGGAVSTEVQPFEKQVTITRYDQTNSLLIVASPQDFKVLDNVIAQLDVPARQVHVEAQILEVSINDRYRLAVETAGLTANDYFALNNIVNLANVLTQGPLGALENTEDITSIGIIDGTTELTLPDGAGGFITQEIPNIPLLLTALESLTALDVLSRPSLTTVDNEEAHILDGQEVPVVTGSQRPLDSGSGVTTSSLFNQTQRRDVGISLTVTPQISEGDYVFLELEVTVERPIQSTIGLDPNLVGPTFSKSEITNKVVVRDGSTGILGGLISESTDRSKRQTPILGDIPGLGWLFRRKDDQRAKRNLVVLLTPHIMKEGIDFERKTQAEIELTASANADVLFEKGFIKKVSTKHKMRQDYRPTDAALEGVRSDESFGRGDVSR
jgi:general secretion pathway protein D